MKWNAGEYKVHTRQKHFSFHVSQKLQASASAAIEISTPSKYRSMAEERPNKRRHDEHVGGDTVSTISIPTQSLRRSNRVQTRSIADPEITKALGKSPRKRRRKDDRKTIDDDGISVSPSALESSKSTALISYCDKIPPPSSDTTTATSGRMLFNNHNGGIDAFCTAVKECTTKSERIQMIREKVDEWSRISEAVDNIAATFEGLARECGIEDREMEAVTDEWSNVKAHASDTRCAVERKLRSQILVCKIFGKADVDNDFKQIEGAGSATWKAFSAFATICGKHSIQYRDAMQYVLQAQINRLGSMRTRKTDIVQPTDFGCARQMILDGKLVPDMLSLLQQLASTGYSLGPNRLISFEHSLTITSKQDKADIDGIETVEVAPISSRQTTGLSGSASLQIDPDQIEVFDEQVDREAVHHNQDIMLENQLEHDLESTGGDTFTSICSFDSDSDEEFDEEDDGYCSDYSATVNAAKRRKKAVQGKIGKRSCKCDEMISSNLLHHCSGKRGRLTDTAQISLIKLWHANRKQGEICWSHTVWITAHVGFKVQSQSLSDMENLLTTFHDHVLNGTLGKYKTDEETYTLFRRENRPVHPEDGLGPYKFFHRNIPKITFTKEDQIQLRKELCIDSVAWERDGSIIMDGMSWWKEIFVDLNGEKRCIYDVVNEEFAMYDYHLRRINDRSNFGWCRTMFHSTVQQVMRQDPWYYLMYCALRGDLCTWLISYPYYTKFAVKDDNTFFRHIDLNIPRLVANKRGFYQIQGSLSMDDEAETDCTEIIPGMHKHMREWYELLLQRNPRLGDYVHRIDYKMFTPEDAKRFNTDWTATPCKSLQIRITDPSIPHGANGGNTNGYSSCKGTRRTMLPWYVSIQPDHQTLEITESGTWSSLATAHATLTSGPATPSGLANRYGDIPYAFPAAVQLTGLGPISDVLVGRVRHDNPTVVFLKQRLLTGAAEFRIDYLQKWREKATRAVIDAFEECRAAEKICFGGKSYFYRIENGLCLDVVEDVDENSGFEECGGHGGEHGGEVREGGESDND